MNPSDPTDDDALQQALRQARTLESAPEHLVQRAIALFDARASAAPASVAAAPASALKRLAAVLSFDSAGRAALAFGRRSGGSATRQLLYTADGRDIDLRVTPVEAADGPRWRISGQVLGPDERGWARLQGESARREVSWNDLAEFSFDSVGAGSWVVVLHGSDWEVELPPIDLPAKA